MTTGVPLPMFPLGTVALPGSVVPLHIFEERYRQLARDLTSGEGRFGIVLIERGSEVGGGDTRSMIGTRMRVAASEEFADGRWALMAIGEDRIRVTTWLPDDPYPMALVERVPDDEDDPEPESVGMAERAVRRALERAARLGYEVPTLDQRLSMDPGTRLWQLASAAPLGPTDRQQVLEAPTAERRADLVAMLALDAAELFALQLRDSTDSDQSGSTYDHPMARLKPAEITDELSDVWRLIVGYAKQETFTPLRGALDLLRWGVMGMTAFAIATGFAAIAIVRVLQTETGDALGGNWSFVPYIASILGCGIVAAFAVRSAAKTPWKKPSEKQEAR